MERDVRSVDQASTPSSQEEVIEKSKKVPSYAKASEGKEGKNDVKQPPKYRRWVILAVIVIAQGIGGYLFVQSYKPDNPAKRDTGEQVVIDGKELPADKQVLSEASEPAGASDPSGGGGMIGPVQMLIILSVPLLFIGIGPSAATFGHIYTGRYSDGSRVFWMVIVWILLTFGVIAYWIFGNRRRSPRSKSESP